MSQSRIKEILEKGYLVLDKQLYSFEQTNFGTLACNQCILNDEHVTCSRYAYGIFCKETNEEFYLENVCKIFNRKFTKQEDEKKNKIIDFAIKPFKFTTTR